jgi:hypothetical protein
MNVTERANLTSAEVKDRATSNIEHPTFNIEWKCGIFFRSSFSIGCSMLDVRCWTLKIFSVSFVFTGRAGGRGRSGAGVGLEKILVGWGLGGQIRGRVTRVMPPATAFGVDAHGRFGRSGEG